MKDNYRLYPEKYVPAIAIESSAAFTMAECIALCDSLKKGPTRNLPCNSFNFNRRESICVASFTDFKTQKKYGVGDLEGDLSVMVNGAADAQMKGWHYGLRLKTGDDDTLRMVFYHKHFYSIGEWSPCLARNWTSDFETCSVSRRREVKCFAAGDMINPCVREVPLHYCEKLYDLDWRPYDPQGFITRDWPSLTPNSSRYTSLGAGHCLLYTSPSPRDYAASRMPSSA